MNDAIKIIETTEQINEKYRRQHLISKYPWRETPVGKSFLVSASTVKFGTLAGLASRTGKRMGRKFTIHHHTVFEGYPEGCYEIACRAVTVAPSMVEEAKNKFKEMADKVPVEQREAMQRNIDIMEEIAAGKLIVPQPRKSKENEEFERVKNLPWNREDTVVEKISAQKLNEMVKSGKIKIPVVQDDGEEINSQINTAIEQANDEQTTTSEQKPVEWTNEFVAGDWK